MKIYDDYIANSLKKGKTKLRPLKLTIFIAVLALTVYSFIFGSIVKNDQEASEKTFGNYHVNLIADLDQDKLSYLANNINIEKLAYLVKNGLKPIDGSNLKIELCSIDDNYSKILEKELIKGNMPKTSGEIVIPLVSAKDLGLELADQLTIVSENGDMAYYKIVGLIDSGFYSWEEEIVGFISLDPNQPIIKADEVAIWYKNMRDTYKLTPEIVENLGFDYETSLTSSINDGPSTELKISYNLIYLSSHFVNTSDIYHSAKSQSYPKIFAIGSLFISIFFVFVINNIFKVWQNSQVREYGLLLSIGAKKEDIKYVIFKKLFIIAILPIILGLFCGTGFSILVLRIMTKYYFLSSQEMIRVLDNGFTLNLTPLLVLFIILVSMLILAFSALGPIRKISKINIIDSMKLYRTEDHKYKKKKLRPESFLTDFSIINSSQNRGKILFSALSISIASLFLCLMLSLLGGLNLDIKYNRTDKLKNFEYKISYINPSPFPKDLIMELTANNKYDHVNYRSNLFYILEENSYKNIIDKSYLETYYDKYTESFGKEISINVIGLDKEKYLEIAESLEIPYESLNIENSGILINSMAKDVSKAIQFREGTKVIDETNTKLIITDYSQQFLEAYSGVENNEIGINIVKYTDDKDLLKVPQGNHFVNFITSMDTYFKILESSKQDHTGMITEEIYFNNENTSIDKIKDLLSKNISDRDLDVVSRSTQNNTEYYSNRILYSLLFSMALIATGLGITQAYAATSAIRDARKQEYTILRIIGMDKFNLRKLTIKEVNQNMKFILLFSIFSLIFSIFLTQSAYKSFSPLQIFLNMKVYIWIGYLFAVYLVLRKYYLKTLDDVSLTNNSRII